MAVQQAPAAPRRGLRRFFVFAFIALLVVFLIPAERQQLIDGLRTTVAQSGSSGGSADSGGDDD
jgi:hypothetical protein